jgi:hypothetical protein
MWATLHIKMKIAVRSLPNVAIGEAVDKREARVAIILAVLLEPCLLVRLAQPSSKLSLSRAEL